MFNRARKIVNNFLACLLTASMIAGCIPFTAAAAGTGSAAQSSSAASQTAAVSDTGSKGASSSSSYVKLHGWVVSVKWNTDTRDYVWDATGNEVRQPNIQVTYSTTKAEKDYEPGELQFTIPGIGDAIRGKRAESDRNSTKDADSQWNYSWDESSDTYTFTNKYKIEKGKKVSGYFEFLWTLYARSCENGFSKTDMTPVFSVDGEKKSMAPLSYQQTFAKDYYQMAWTYPEPQHISANDYDANDTETYVWYEFDTSFSPEVKARGTAKADYFIGITGYDESKVDPKSDLRAKMGDRELDVTYNDKLGEWGFYPFKDRSGDIGSLTVKPIIGFKRSSLEGTKVTVHGHLSRLYYDEDQYTDDSLTGDSTDTCDIYYKDFTLNSYAFGSGGGSGGPSASITMWNDEHESYGRYPQYYGENRAEIHNPPERPNDSYYNEDYKKYRLLINDALNGGVVDFNLHGSSTLYHQDSAQGAKAGTFDDTADSEEDSEVDVDSWDDLSSWDAAEGFTGDSESAADKSEENSSENKIKDEGSEESGKDNTAAPSESAESSGQETSGTSENKESAADASSEAESTTKDNDRNSTESVKTGDSSSAFSSVESTEKKDDTSAEHQNSASTEKEESNKEESTDPDDQAGSSDTEGQTLVSRLTGAVVRFFRPLQAQAATVSENDEDADGDASSSEDKSQAELKEDSSSDDTTAASAAEETSAQDGASQDSSGEEQNSQDQKAKDSDGQSSSESSSEAATEKNDAGSLSASSAETIRKENAAEAGSKENAAKAGSEDADEAVSEDSAAAESSTAAESADSAETIEDDAEQEEAAAKAAELTDDEDDREVKVILHYQSRSDQDGDKLYDFTQADQTIDNIFSDDASVKGFTAPRIGGYLFDNWTDGDGNVVSDKRTVQPTIDGLRELAEKSDKDTLELTYTANYKKIEGDSFILGDDEFWVYEKGGEARELSADEYDFTSVTVQKNAQYGNDYTVYASSDNTSAFDDYTSVGTGNTSEEQFFRLPNGTKAFYVKFDGINGTEEQYIQPEVSFHLNEKSDVDPDGHIVNYGYVRHLRKTGDEWKDIAQVSEDYDQGTIGKRLADHDQHAYGEYVRRNYSNVWLRSTIVSLNSYTDIAEFDGGGRKGYTTTISAEGSVQSDASSSLGKFSVYTLIPKGMELDLDNISASISATYVGGGSASSDNPKVSYQIITKDGQDYLAADFDYSAFPLDMAKKIDVRIKMPASLSYDHFIRYGNRYSTASYLMPGSVGGGTITTNNRTQDVHDFDGDGDKSEVMAYSWDSEDTLGIAEKAETIIEKGVKTAFSQDEFVSDSVALQSDGDPSNTDQPKSAYTYRLDFYLAAGKSNKAVFYDHLEQGAVTEKSDGSTSTEQSGWQGYFQSVDTAAAAAKGLKPTVYYSESADQSEDLGAAGWQMMQQNGNIWTADGTVKSIAVALDPSSMKDQVIPAKSDVYVLVNMLAPGDAKLIGKKAVNQYTAAFDLCDDDLQFPESDVTKSNACHVDLEKNVGKVTIKKVDADNVTGKNADGTPEYAGLSGAVIQLYQNQLQKDGTYKMVQYGGARKVNKLGIIGPLTLPYGDYAYEEVTAPKGYSKIEGQVAFTVNQEVQEIDIQNMRLKGAVKLIKEDADDNAREEDEREYNGTKALKGAVFALHRTSDNSLVNVTCTDENNSIYTYADDSKDSAGSSSDAKTQTVSELKTNAQGQLVIKGLKWGSYYFVEKSAPEGYQLSTGKHYFQIDEENAADENGIEVSVADTEKRSSFELLKTDATTGDHLKGAIFDLYRQNKDGSWSRQQVNLRTGAGGRLEVQNLNFGHYALFETQPPEGYELPYSDSAIREMDQFKDESGDKLDKDVLQYEIKNYGQAFDVTPDTAEDTENGQIISKEMKNAEKTGAVRITKWNEDETLKLGGAQFGIFRKDAGGDVRVYAQPQKVQVNGITVDGYAVCSADAQGAVDTFETRALKDGESADAVPDYGMTPYIAGLAWGSYYIKEVAAPDGYELEDQEIPFEISQTNVEIPQEISASDSRMRGAVTLIKADDTYRQNYLEGAEFKLYSKDSKPLTLYHYKATPYIYSVDPGSSHLDPKAGLSRLKEGETNTLESTTVLVTDIGNDGVDPKVNDPHENDEEDGKDDTEGRLTVYDLDWNNYYFEETKAPQGYSLTNDKVRFSINSTTCKVKQNVFCYDREGLGQIVVGKKINEAYAPFGNPTFIFHADRIGTDGKSEEEYTQAVTLTEGDLSGQVTFADLPLGTYRISEVEVQRYKQEKDGVSIVSGRGQVYDRYAEVTLTDDSKEASLSFSNEIRQYEMFSHVASATNIVPVGKKLTGLIVDYTGGDIDAYSQEDGQYQHTIKTSDLKVTAVYDDGSTKELGPDDYTLDKTAVDTSVPDTGYTITVTHKDQKSDITVTGTFDVYVKPAGSINGHRVIYRANGGYFGTDTSRQVNVVAYDTDGNVEENYTYLEPNSMTSVFRGWYKDKNLTETFDPEKDTKGLQKDITVYAKWEVQAKEFDYTGDVQEYTVPADGTYRLEAWGAQGGGIDLYDKSTWPRYAQGYEVGGKGGYAAGDVHLKKGTVLYVYVGGTTTTGKGGWNGGGSHPHANVNYGGGGGTDFSLSDNYDTHWYSRILTAGGGGGALLYPGENGYAAGGYGGYPEGQIGQDNNDYGAGGTQTSGGYTSHLNIGRISHGSFGLGGTDNWCNEQLGQGGGGWYGGGAGGGSGRNGAGGGGSSHAYTQADASVDNKDFQKICSKLGSDYYMTNVTYSNGVREFNGHAKISMIKEDPSK